MYKIIFILIFLSAIFTSKAQLLDSLTLDTTFAFTSIEEALKNPDAVVKLVLRKQKFKSFPTEIFKLKNLQYLDISKNSIKYLPDSIGTLKNLQYFSCSKTGLEKIPGEIGQLSNLKYLNLNQNEIEYLPPQIGNLESLEILDLWSNNFSEYPSSLASLTKLKVLDLRNILINEERQNFIKGMLPKTTIYMSPSCTCKW
jgi:Leucine-rich repeat (LRR) protein